LPIRLNLRITVVGGSSPTDKVAAADPVILLANSYGVVRPEVDLVHPVDCQWYKGRHPVRGGKGTVIELDSATLLDGAIYSLRIKDGTGMSWSASTAVGVVTPPPTKVYGMKGAPVVISGVKSSGSGMRFQWYYRGQPLSPSRKYYSVREKFLLFFRASAEDEGDYSLRAQMGATTFDVGPVYLDLINHVAGE
jgi:hypothetical protein